MQLPLRCSSPPHVLALLPPSADLWLCGRQSALLLSYPAVTICPFNTWSADACSLSLPLPPSPPSLPASPLAVFLLPLIIPFSLFSQAKGDKLHLPVSGDRTERRHGEAERRRSESTPRCLDVYPQLARLEIYLRQPHDLQ